MNTKILSAVLCTLVALPCSVIATGLENKGPVSQKQFCEIIDDYRASYDAAEKSNNEIQLNNVMKQRSDDLDALLPNGEFKDWEVSFLKATSSSTGGANVCMYISYCNVILQNGILAENLAEKSDYSVQYGSREYRAVSGLGIADPALLSGSLTKVSKYQNGSKEYTYRKESLNDESSLLSSNCEVDLTSSLLGKELKNSTTGDISRPQFFFFELDYIAPIK
jgi:hypothetical protein